MIENVLNGYGTVAYSVCDKMPWYNEEAVTEYDLDAAKALMEEAGWIEGDDGIREKDGEKAELTIMFSNGDSVRQALAEDSANQLRELGIDVTTSGVGWDTAYDQAQSAAYVGLGRPYAYGALQYLSHHQRYRKCGIFSICK